MLNHVTFTLRTTRTTRLALILALLPALTPTLTNTGAGTSRNAIMPQEECDLEQGTPSTPETAPSTPEMPKITEVLEVLERREATATPEMPEITEVLKVLEKREATATPTPELDPSIDFNKAFNISWPAFYETLTNILKPTLDGSESEDTLEKLQILLHSRIREIEQLSTGLTHEDFLAQARAILANPFQFSEESPKRTFHEETMSMVLQQVKRKKSCLKTVCAATVIIIGIIGLPALPIILITQKS